MAALDEHGVTFRWKDYRVDGRTRNKTMTLEAEEFVRRFLLQVLPGGFHRIRHYGLLANPSRRENFAKIRKLLDVVPAGVELGANVVSTVAVPPMIIIDILQRSRPIRAPPAATILDVWYPVASDAGSTFIRVTVWGGLRKGRAAHRRNCQK